MCDEGERQSERAMIISESRVLEREREREGGEAKKHNRVTTHFAPCCKARLGVGVS